MKRQILLGLFLLTIFCAVPVFAQEKSDLVTETIKFNKIEISPDKKENFLSAFLKPLLSKNGTVKFDAKGQNFIFTDTPNRIKLIKKFTEILDNSGFRSGDWGLKSGKSKKLVSEFAETFYIFPALSCDVGEELRLAKLALQERPLTKVIEEIQVKIESVGIYDSHKGLTLTGTKHRVALARKFVALFDQPILIEDNDF